MLTSTSSNEDIRAYYYNFDASIEEICEATNLSATRVQHIIKTED